MHRQTIKRGGTRKTAHKNMTKRIKEICNEISNNYKENFYAIENLVGVKWVYVIIYAKDKMRYYAGWNRLDDINKHDFHDYKVYRNALNAILHNKV